MPALLTAASTMLCPHGGIVTAVPGQSSALAGAPILLQSDTFLIAGCALASLPAPSPCLTVQWVTAATRVTAGAPVLTESSVGLCLAATQAPQGTVIIAATQSEVSGL